FRAWHDALEKIGPANQKGLRATGSSAHENYVDDLINDLERAGVKQVQTASYIPYSGRTPAGGVTGPMVYVEPGTTPAPGSLAGKIAVFDVPITVLTYGAFELVEY